MDYKIRITCTSEGEFDPPVPTVKLGNDDTAEWICDDGNYALNFGWHTPFKKGRYQASKGEKIKPRRHPRAQHGQYKYFIAVLVDGNIWTDDPDVIIRP